MKTTVSIDKAGRLVLPKPIRDGLHLSAGDAVEIESSSDQVILRPACPAGLQKKRGIWVVRTGERLSQETVDDAIDGLREERASRSLGADR